MTVPLGIAAFIFMWIWFLIHTDKHNLSEHNRLKTVGANTGQLSLRRDAESYVGEITCNLGGQSSFHGSKIVTELKELPNFRSVARRQLQDLVAHQCIPDDTIVDALIEHVRLGAFGGPVLVPAKKAIHFMESDRLIVPDLRNGMELYGDVREMTWEDDMMVIIEVLPEQPSQQTVFLLQHVADFLDDVSSGTVDVPKYVEEVMEEGSHFEREMVNSENERFSVDVWTHGGRFTLIRTERLSAADEPFGAVTEEAEEVCPVCFEPREIRQTTPLLVENDEGSTVLKHPIACRHCFHPDCVSQWAQKDERSEIVSVL